MSRERSAYEEQRALSSTTEHAQARLAYLDPQFNFVWVSSAYASNWGHSRGELIGHNYFALFPSQETQSVFEQARKTGHPVEFHTRPLEHDDQPEHGTPYWDWTLAPMKDGQGRVQGLLLSLTQVSEHQRAQQALHIVLEESRQRQAEFSEVLTASRTILGCREFETTARSMFDSCKRLTGASGGYVALLSKDGTENEVLFLDAGRVACTVDPALLMPMRGLREQVYRTGKAVYENRFSDSEWVALLPRGHMVLDNVLFAPLLLSEITVGLLGLANKSGGFTEDDLRIASAFGELVALALLNTRALQSLQHSEERFRAVAQTAGDAIIAVDSRGRVVFWNEAAERIFGYTRYEAMGRPIAFIMPKRFHTAHQDGIERVTSTGETRIIGETVEMAGLRKDGFEFPIELSLSSWETREGTFFTGIIRDITERVRSEAAQRESEAKWQSLVNNAPNFITIVDREGIIEFVNHTVPGLAVKDVVGRDVCDFVQPEYRTLAKRKIKGVFESGETDSFVSAALGPDGVVAWYENLLGPIEQEGQVDAVTIIATDISERVRAEEALRKQNQFITTVFESLAHPFYVVDANDYTIEMANAATRTGEWPELLTCYALTHRLDAPCQGADHFCPLEEIKRTGRAVVTEHVHYDSQGKRRTYQVHGHPICDSQGEVSQIIEYTLDITDRVRAEEQVRSLSRFPSENPNPVLRIAGGGTVLYANQAALPLLRAWGCQVGQPLPGEWRELTVDALRSGLRRDIELAVEDRVLSLTFAPVTDADYVNVYGLDISERVRAEEALKNARDELEVRVQERTAALATANEELRAVANENAELYKAERLARRTAETLSAASLALTETLDLDHVTDTLLDYVGRLVPYDRAIFMLPEDETHLVVRAVRGVDRRSSLQGMVGTTVDTRADSHIRELLTLQKSLLIPDTRSSPDWQHLAQAGHVLSWLGVPLVSEDKVIGLCALEKNEPECYREEHIQLAEALVSQAAVAIQNAWLFEQVRAGRERLRALSQRLVEVQETERRYIARELHDEAGQALTSLMVGLRLLEREADNPEAIVAGVTELEQRIDGVLENLHRLAADLRPASLDHLGLVAALRQYAEKISDRHALTVQFEAVGFDARLPPDIEIALYRIVQEAMTNVIRHAQATRADILLTARGEVLIAIIEDNGVGFDPTAPVVSGRLGLVGIRERVEMMGGTLTVETAADSGTTLLVEVPYADTDPDRR